MKLSFGEHRGQELQNVIVQHPEYIASIMSLKHPSGPVAAVIRETLQMLREFDEEPLNCPCASPGCPGKATRCVVAQGKIQPAFYCDRCNPLADGPSQVIRTYREAVDFVRLHHRGAVGPLQKLVRALARAKGLDRPVA